MNDSLGDKASQGGCCFDCGRFSCDKSCIQAIAELECRLVCGTEGKNDLNDSGLGHCYNQPSVDNELTETDSCEERCCASADKQASKTHPSGKRTSFYETERPVLCCTSSPPDKIATCCSSVKNHDAQGSCADACCASSGMVDQCQDVQIGCCEADNASICCSDADSDSAEKCCTNLKTTDASQSSVDRCCASSGAADPCKDVEAGCCALSKEDQSCKRDRKSSSVHDQDAVTKGCCSILKKETDTSSDCASSGTVDSCKDDGATCCAPTTSQRCKDKTKCSIADDTEATTNDCCSTVDRSTTPMVACDTHLRRAFEEFAVYIEKGLCICRSVIDRYDGETCCTKRQAKTDTPVTAATSSMETTKSNCRNRKKAFRSTSMKATNAKQSILETRVASEIQEVCPLEDPIITNDHHRSPRKLPLATTVIDVEKFAARQHVVLSVSGMTCTGCSRKLENVLQRTEGVSDFRVMFISGTAELDLDTCLITKELLIRKLEKETGFKCSPIESEFQTLDLLIGLDSAERLQHRLPRGIESTTRISKDKFRISYDPSIIGARSILSSIPDARLTPPAPDDKLAAGKKRLRAMAWATTLAAIFTIPILVLNWSDNPVSHTTRSIVSLILATFPQAIAIPEFYKPALTSLIYSRMIETDMLVVISISAAYGYSVVAACLGFAGYELEVQAFFETSSLLITLVLFGRLMSSVARVKAVGAVSVRSLQAEKALLVVNREEETITELATEEVDARLLQLNDVFVVKPHGRIVTDGVIIDGHSSVDESMLTGESTPVAKGPGDTTIAGTINGPTTLVVRLTRLPGKNSITDIASLVEGALAAKPRFQDLADQVASWFVPVVVCISVVVFVVWLAIAFKVRQEAAGGAVGTAITYTIAVLAVSCPCAIGLAVPLVLVIAGGVGARCGIIIKSAEVTEMAYKVTDVVFDKTGTLTTGELEVQEMRSLENGTITKGEVASLVRSLVKDNDHPVSRAVYRAIRQENQTVVEAKDIKSVPGSGIQAKFRSLSIKAGNPFWLGIEQHPTISDLLEQGLTLFCLTLDSKPTAVWILKSSLRPEAHSVIHYLHKRNITCHVVSGDNPRAVQAIAAELQISPTHTASRQSPADKQRFIQRLQQTSRDQRKRTVLFLGDGTNDAVAVAQADVGVQIATSGNITSDVTRATADVVLLGGLDGVPALFDLSRRAVRRIHFNFVWSGVYNLVAILFAAGAFVKVRLLPAYAGLGEIVSIAPVIVAAVTLMRRKGVVT